MSQTCNYVDCYHKEEANLGGDGEMISWVDLCFTKIADWCSVFHCLITMIYDFNFKVRGAWK